jgi:hypothetical protein
MKLCKKIFVAAEVGDFVYCPNGDRHLVDISIDISITKREMNE